MSVDDALPWRDTSVLLLGCGSIGRRHARLLHSLGVRDIRLFDPVPKQAAGVASEVPGTTVEDSIEAALARCPDAVFVLAPPEHHVDLSVRALNAGCHVFCEKPLSYQTRELPRLAETVQRAGRVFMVGLCFRFHPGVRAVYELVHVRRAIGRLVAIRGMVGEHLPSVRPDYRDLFSSRYLGAFDLIHDMDLAIWFAGGAPSRVEAIYGNYSDIDIGAPDLAEVLMDFGGRCLASVHLDFFQIPRRRYLELLGVGGVARIDFGAWDRYTIDVLHPSREADVHIERTTERDAMFVAEDRQFLTAITAGGNVETDLEQGTLSVRALEAIYRVSLDEPETEEDKESHA